MQIPTGIQISISGLGSYGRKEPSYQFGLLVASDGVIEKRRVLSFSAYEDQNILLKEIGIALDQLKMASGQRKKITCPECKNTGTAPCHMPDEIICASCLVRNHVTCEEIE